MATAVFDGHYLLHRVMHVPQLRMLATKDNKPTGAVFGFIKSLRATVGSFKEVRKIVVVFDGGARSKRREEIYPEYKKREKKDDVDPDGLTYQQKFQMQLNYLKFMLPRLGIKMVQLPGREGDDVVAFIARNLKDHLKIVVSDDKDMYQLVSEDIHIWRPLKGERVSLQNFEDIARCKLEHFLLRKSVLGDSSDNISGIKGVGEKTVDKVLDVCGDIGPYPHDNFFEAAMLMSSRKAQAIAENLDVVLRNFELIDIDREEFTDEELERILGLVNAPAKFDVLAVRRLFTGLEFFSLVEDFDRWVTPFQMLR